MRALESRGHANLITRTRAELDLTNQAAVNEFFASDKPEVVFLAAAKVGGIMANNTYRADFIYENIAIATNVIRAAYVEATALHERVPDLFVNVGTESEIAIRDLAELIAHVVGYEGEIEWDTSKPNGTPRKLMDSPRIDLRGGIRSTYEWYAKSAACRSA